MKGARHHLMKEEGKLLGIIGRLGVTLTPFIVLGLKRDIQISSCMIGWGSSGLRRWSCRAKRANELRDNYRSGYHTTYFQPDLLEHIAYIDHHTRFMLICMWRRNNALFVGMPNVILSER